MESSDDSMDPFHKALLIQMNQDKLRRQAQGERTGLTDRRHRADPTARQRVPELPNVSAGNPHGQSTPDWVSQLPNHEVGINPIPEIDPIRRNVSIGGSASSQRLPANAESELEKIRQQLRRAYGRDD